MNIIVSTENLTTRLKIIGGLSAAGKESLADSLDEILSLKVKHVYLDLSLVPFISSSGIAKLVEFHKKLKGQKAKLTIIDIHENLYHQFTSLNLYKVFKIEKNMSPE